LTFTAGNAVATKFWLSMQTLKLAAGTTVNFLDNSVISNSKTLLERIDSASTVGSPVTIAPANAGASQNIDITETNKAKSFVLDFNYAALTNVLCSSINTVYAKGTQSGCINVYNQTAKLVGECPYDVTRSKISDSDFNTWGTLT